MINFIQFTMTRAVMAVFTLFIVSLIVFTLMELVPGTCAERYLAFKNTQGSGITVEDIEAEERRLGLDRPFPVRFGSWIKNIVVDGDFGDSCILRVSINELLKERFFISLSNMYNCINLFLSHSYSGRDYICYNQIQIYRHNS